MANEGLGHTDEEPKRLGRVDLLERALGRLRSESREALVLARFHDLPHQQLDDLGLAAMAGGDFQLVHPGTPRAHLVVQTTQWSDGTKH